MRPARTGARDRTGAEAGTAAKCEPQAAAAPLLPAFIELDQTILLDDLPVVASSFQWGQFSKHGQDPRQRQMIERTSNQY